MAMKYNYYRKNRHSINSIKITLKSVKGCFKSIDSENSFLVWLRYKSNHPKKKSNHDTVYFKRCDAGR